jgi:DNA repair protein SbcD/Mre11
MKFIHAADIHLDSPLVGLSAYPEAPVQLLRNATRDALDKLVSEALALEVDFLVIAGDLYDGNWKDFNTGIFFARQMGRLNEKGIPVFLLFGNHDAESEMTKALVLPPNVHVFPTNKVASFTLPALQVVLHGRSFKTAATTDNLALQYPPARAAWLNIGVLHTALEGNAAHANYAPCSLAQLQAHGYQYWALGHVHEHQLWRGEAVVAFPGNLQGRHIREQGPRGALLVSAEGTRITAVERLICDVLRWQELVIDASVCEDFDDVVRAAGAGLEQLLRVKVHSHPLAVRVRIVGASAAHGALFALDAHLRAQVQASAAALDANNLWIEQVQIQTSAVVKQLPKGDQTDALIQLQSLLAQAPADEEFLLSLQEDLLHLVSKMPMELQSLVPFAQDIRSGNLQELVRTTTPTLLAHLAASEKQ